MAIKRALIVDDSTTAQYRLKKLLKPYNLQIDIVDSGQAALRYLASNLPDVIFMDHTMPGMDGLRALQIIKSHPETATVPVIMYTAKSGDVYTGQARALGALDVVSKDSINATDLSKVLHTIHIYPDNPIADKSVESPELIAAANQVSLGTGELGSGELGKGEPSTRPEQTNAPSPPAADFPVIERRAADQAALELTRNLELRLGQLEHKLEDSRRFITSRLVRELQQLRQELGERIKNLPPATVADPAPAARESVAAPPSGNWLAVILMVLVAVALYYLITISTGLKDSRAQQLRLEQTLSASSASTTNAGAATSAPAVIALQPTEAPTGAYSEQQVLDDLSWAFNQSGALAFQQNNLDNRAPVRVYEFVNRLLDQGFRGTVAIDIFVGDFCLSLNPLGQAELAPASSTLGNCMLSSEAYTLERLADNYLDQLSLALNNLVRDHADTLALSVHAYPGPEAYPERLPITSASEWNAIAQRNNRLEIHLAPR